MESNKRSIIVGIYVFALLVFGKFLSLFRDIIFSMFFGTSVYADAYFSANIIPGLLNMTFVMSALVFFIPIYSECITSEGKEEASYFTSNLMTIFFLFNLLLSIIAFFLAPQMIKIVGPGLDTETYAISVKLVRMLVWSFPITAVVHVLINVSNANQKHLAPQLITVFNSLLSIVLMFIFVPKYGIYSVPLIGILAWLVQIFLQQKFVENFYRYKIIFNLKDKRVKKILILSIPVIVATATVQINLSIDNMWSSTLGIGSVSMLNYAQKVFNLINGTFTMALITVSYPILSTSYARKEYYTFFTNIKRNMRVIVFIMLPIVILCIICREEIIKIIYFRGTFKRESVRIVADLFMIYAMAIIFSGIKELSTRTYYIMEDSRTPTKISVFSIVINIFLNFILVRSLGVYGIAIATLVSTIVACCIQIILLKKKINSTFNLDFQNMNISDMFQIITSTICLSFVGYILHTNILIGNNILSLIFIFSVCLLVYVFLLKLFRNDLLMSVEKN